MMKFEDIANWIWGLPLLILIVGGGLIISIKTEFFQLKYLPFIIKETFGKMFSKDTEGEGTISPFQATTTALASSIGAANIVVVPSIIYMAGPGAIFWMWIAAIVGQATKFGEIVLGIKYREKNEYGEYVGGASYYLDKGIPGKIGKILGILVAFFFMIEILASIPVQSLSAAESVENLGTELGMNSSVVRCAAVLLVFILVALVVYGGIKKIAQVTEKLVPIMSAVYLLCGLIIILKNITEIPTAFGYIFKGAFNPKAIGGGIGHASLMTVIKAGIARGVYSNEAGMGSAPYGHSTAITDHPARQGIWGVFEVIVDTIIVCTMSALVVIVSGTWKPDMSVEQINAVSSVAIERAFNSNFGIFGSFIISICLFLFVLSTIIVIVYYCEKQAEYLFGSEVGKMFRAIATFVILTALFMSFNNAGVFLDITLALVVIPNMLGVIYMSEQIKNIKDDFFNNPEYYPSAK